VILGFGPGLVGWAWPLAVLPARVGDVEALALNLKLGGPVTEIAVILGSMQEAGIAVRRAR